MNMWRFRWSCRKPTDERVRNLMKELETIEPEDPRADLFSKAS